MIVEDRLDPSGMFSKAGRLSLEMYVMLQEKDQVLFNKPKDSKSIEHLSNKPPQQGNDKHRSFQPREQYREGKRNLGNGAAATLNSSFFKAVSRQQADELRQKMGNTNDKFGMYNPKFHLVFEKSPFYPDLESIENKERARNFQAQNIHFAPKKQSKKNLPLPISPPPLPSHQQSQQLHHSQSQAMQHSLIVDKNHSMIGSVSSMHLNNGNNNMNTPKASGLQNHGLSSINTSSIASIQQQGGQNLNNSLNASISARRQLNNSISDSSILGIDFDKPKRHIACPVAFNKQSARKPMLTSTIPHDERFNLLQIPSVSSRSHHIPNISFVTHGRSNQIFGSKNGGLDYNVNYSSIYPRETLGVLDYSKTTARKSNDKPVYTLNEQLSDNSYYAVGVSDSNLHKKVTAPKFSKMPGRYIHDLKLTELIQQSQNNTMQKTTKG